MYIHNFWSEFAGQVNNLLKLCYFLKKLLISEAFFVLILPFNQNRFSGLSYSLNSASFKAENSLNWLVFFFVSIIF